jgi:hypothetical protein
MIQYLIETIEENQREIISAVDDLIAEVSELFPEEWDGQERREIRDGKSPDFV